MHTKQTREKAGSAFARALLLHYRLSAAIWLTVPSLLLLAFRSSGLEPLVRVQPYNDSYDAMFIAALAGIGLTSVWKLVTLRRDRGTSPSSEQAFVGLGAFEAFEVVLSASLATLHFIVGTLASGTVYAAVTVTLAWTLHGVRPSPQEAGRCPIQRSRSTPELLASMFLLAFAVLFIAFPVLQSWSGPPEPFVRWHPFGNEPELIWRGVFFSFASGMLLAALDPACQGRLFLVALVLSGSLHAAEMAADNLHSAAMHAMNGNPQHLYGDVLGWSVVALAALLFLLVVRSPAYPASTAFAAGQRRSEHESGKPPTGVSA